MKLAAKHFAVFNKCMTYVRFKQYNIHTNTTHKFHTKLVMI